MTSELHAPDEAAAGAGEEEEAGVEESEVVSADWGAGAAVPRAMKMERRSIRGYILIVEW